MTRTLPVDEALERAVLGACMFDVEAVAAVVDTLTPEDFAAHPHHRKIYQAIVALYRRGEPVDLMLVLEELGPGLETTFLVTEIAGDLTSTANAASYAARLAKTGVRRAAIHACEASLSELYEDDDSDDPVALALARLLAVQAKRADRAVSVGTVLEDVVAATRTAFDARGRNIETGPAVTTGLYDLDRILFVGATDYIVLAARPSAGKTALVLQILDHVSQTVPVYMASLEMSKEAITRRMLAAKTGINAYRQRIGHLTHEEMGRLANAAVDLGGRLLNIDDRAGLTVAQIMAGAQVQQVREGLGLVVIDHMSLVSPANSRGSLYEGMTQISKDVKNLTRRLGVPVIALAQLSRDVDKADRKPRPSDLRDSGGVEQDADAILMLHRPDRQSSFAEAELCVAKQRDGPCGDVALFFEAERTRFRLASEYTAS